MENVQLENVYVEIPLKVKLICCRNKRAFMKVFVISSCVIQYSGIALA